jgi:hypothetical protein
MALTDPFTREINTKYVPLGITSSRRSDAIPPDQDIYGFLIGDWAIQSIAHKVDGSQISSEGSWSFRWILHGTAIEDVIGGNRIREDGVWHAGVGIRFYDAADRVWRLTYVEPFTNTVKLLTAQKRGDTIVQTVQGPGPAETWCFESIQPDSFHWISRVADVDARARVDQEIFARRA